MKCLLCDTKLNRKSTHYARRIYLSNPHPYIELIPICQNCRDKIQNGELKGFDQNVITPPRPKRISLSKAKFRGRLNKEEVRRTS
jgi:hypothetical protein